VRLINERTSDVLEVPPPDESGAGVVKFNGRVVARCLYSDVTGSVTLGDGRCFGPDTWAKFIIEQLESGYWEAVSDGA
jgi:hypothetical protein